MTDQPLLTFVTQSISSIWALELLLLLKRDSAKSWDAEALVAEMRSSGAAVAEAAATLQAAGLIGRDGTGAYRYHATSERLDRLVSDLEREYATSPMTIIKAISAPSCF